MRVVKGYSDQEERVVSGKSYSPAAAGVSGVLTMVESNAQYCTHRRVLMAESNALYCTHFGNNSSE